MAQYHRAVKAAPGKILTPSKTNPTAVLYKDDDLHPHGPANATGLAR